jgi:hypothetical protein
MICKYCKKTFFRSESDIKRGRTEYCSMECYQTHKLEKTKNRVEAILKNNKKQCQMCKKTLSLDNFFKSKQTKDGFGSYCKECKIINNRENWNKNKHKHIEQRANSHLINTYGITLNQYQNILDRQNGVCAICQQKSEKIKLAVDHDHNTGKIRGLLCRDCNQAIGLLKDNVVLLEKAKEYLQKETSIKI